MLERVKRAEKQSGPLPETGWGRQFRLPGDLFTYLASDASLSYTALASSNCAST